LFIEVGGDLPTTPAEPTPVAEPHPPTPATDETAVTVNGVPVPFTDQDPVIVDGRTLVPVRGVFEMLGFDVEWENETRTAVISNAVYEVRITIDRAEFTTNGVSHTLDVPAQNIGGRTMVPIRLPLESLTSMNISVGWDNDTRTVVITTN
jgi:hypothetical protein